MNKYVRKVADVRIIHDADGTRQRIIEERGYELNRSGEKVFEQFERILNTGAAILHTWAPMLSAAVGMIFLFIIFRDVEGPRYAPPGLALAMPLCATVALYCGLLLLGWIRNMQTRPALKKFLADDPDFVKALEITNDYFSQRKIKRLLGKSMPQPTLAAPS